MSELRYHVLGNCVLLRPDPTPDYSRQQGYTHVVVPDAYRVGPTDPPCWGTILAFGPECQLNKVCWASPEIKREALLHVGDRVLYGKFSWAKLPLDATTHYAIVREGDLLAVEEQCSPT